MQRRPGVFPPPHIVDERGRAITLRWEQNVLASLIESGTYERHVRRLRRGNDQVNSARRSFFPRP
jgi:hypothetical protein